MSLLVEPTTLVTQTGRAGDVVPYLAERGLGVSSVTPSAPIPGYVTVAVRAAEEIDQRPLLLVGDRHGPTGTGPAFSGTGSSARRLTDLLGAHPLRVATTMNINEGERDPIAARRLARTILRTWEGWVVACGRRAAAAFDVEDFLTWHGRVGAIPHPSGRCRLWNDPEYVTAARLFLQPALPSSSAGANDHHPAGVDIVALQQRVTGVRWCQKEVRSAGRASGGSRVNGPAT